jgi:emopamil binding protein
MSLRARPLDCALVAGFALFAFTSLVMEPYFVFGDIAHPRDLFARGWHWYAQFDPVFLDRPLYLRIVCAIDLFVFGPFYLLSIYAFWRQRDWIRIPFFIFAGIIFYSTVVYFLYELVGESARANIPVVIAVNIPYSIIPILAAYRLRRSFAH